jgi:hypothetical protein
MSHTQLFIYRHAGEDANDQMNAVQHKKQHYEAAKSRYCMKRKKQLSTIQLFDQDLCW